MQVTDEMVRVAAEAMKQQRRNEIETGLCRATYEDMAKLALTAALAAMWRADFEVAPNMDPVLLAIRGRKLPIAVFKFNAGGSWRYLESGKEVEGNLAPTHFMLIPSPPEKE